MQRTKIQDNHYPFPVDLIKTCAVKKPCGKKHLLSGKRVPTPTIPKSDQSNQIKYQTEIKKSKKTQLKQTNFSVPSLFIRARYYRS